MRSLVISAVTAVIMMSASPSVLAQAHWSLGTGERLEVIRDYYCFDEGRGRRQAVKTVRFTGEVQTGPGGRSEGHAEVFRSGFNTWYSRHVDQHLAGYRVDTWIERIWDTPCVDCPELDHHLVVIHIEYTMQDVNPTSTNDSTMGCVGFTVIAGTR